MTDRRTHLTDRGTARPGFTLAELLVSLSATSILMLGLMSALMLAVQTVPTDDDDSVRASHADTLFEYLLAETMIASEILAADGRVRLTVPDQTGDGSDDDIEYRLEGALVQRRVNSGEARTLLAGVASMVTSTEESDGTVARLSVTLKADRDWVFRTSFETSARPESTSSEPEDADGVVKGVVDLLGL